MPHTTPPCWSFTPFRPGVRARESQVEKFFKSDATDRVKSVIHEGIQNSLDAALEAVVNVRICLGETTAAEIARHTLESRDHWPRQLLTRIQHPACGLANQHAHKHPPSATSRSQL